MMIHIKTLVQFLPLILATLLWSGMVKAQDTGAGHKIVFQLSDNDQASQIALTNQLKNLTSGWPDAKFVVVVHSAGINYLQKSESPFANELADLSALGVEFKACENTLQAKNITHDDILDVAGFVPLGIGEVVLKQEQGWSYIKAGL